MRYIDPDGLKYAEIYAAWGAAIGATVVATASVPADAGTVGVNILATPAEVAAGGALGAYVGYQVGAALDNYLLSQGKGERKWEKGRGDDPFWDKTVEELKEIEKKSPDPNERARAKKIRKQKQKKCPNR